MAILIAAFLALVLGLIAMAGLLGMLTALFLARRRTLMSLLVAMAGPGADRSGMDKTATSLIHLLIAALLSALAPIVAGVSYALSGTQWMLEIFGDLGRVFWAWAAGAFLVGAALGAAFPGPRGRDDAPSARHEA